MCDGIQSSEVSTGSEGILKHVKTQSVLEGYTVIKDNSLYRLPYRSTYNMLYDMVVHQEM